MEPQYNGKGPFVPQPQGRSLRSMKKPLISFEDDPLLENKESSNTKQNILRYIGVLFCCLTYAYFFGGFFPYTLLYLVLALPVMSLLHLFFVCFFFRISERLNERTFIKGEYASYHLLLQNSSIFFMPYITIRMYMEGQFICKSLKSMRISLPPFASRQFQYDMPLLFRGRYDIGVKSIKINDLLGMFSYTLHPMEKKSILVKPRIVDIMYKDVPVARISEGDLSSGYKESGNDEVMDIRQYVYGDSYRKIHWKLSTKLEKTMVKETRNELDNDVLILLNLQKPEKIDEKALLEEDCLIEEVVSQIHYLIKRNVPVKLCYFKDQSLVLRASTTQEFQAMYQFLSEIKFNQTNNEHEDLDYFTDNEHNSNLVYLFTVVLDGDLMGKTFHIKNKGFDVELFYIRLKGAEEDEEASKELADILIKNNIRVWKLEPSVLEIEACQHEIHQNLTSEVGAYES